MQRYLLTACTLGIIAAAMMAGAATSWAGKAAEAPTPHWDAPGVRNPIIPGFFADPSIVRYRGEWFVFATQDPWGGDKLGLWRSRDFREWTFQEPNWPTKAAATSPTSGDSMVWAPSVVQGRDGRFWMYVSIGSEVWVGVADHPAGPWRDANGGKPLVPGNYRPGFHMIDAEAFIDDDGQAYLYWGSGLKWVNGHCFVVKLKPDMVTFDGEPQDVTPSHYFEGPFMFKQDGRYYLTYSWGNTTKDTYQVRYAVGSSPMGPFVETQDMPLLATEADQDVVSPGHHAIFRDGGQAFILYHRQALPFANEGLKTLRQIAVDRLMTDVHGLKVVKPTHMGANLPGAAMTRRPGRSFAITSSQSAPGHGAAHARDDNYATYWQAQDTQPAWLQADFGHVQTLGTSSVRILYPMRKTSVDLLKSQDGKRWEKVASLDGVEGSPLALPAIGKARFVRLSWAKPADAALFEWSFAR